MQTAAMNPSALIGPVSVGVAAGVCSALLFVAGAGGSLILALLLFTLAPLPVFIAGLGWGPQAVLCAGAAGMATSAIVQGPRLAVVYVIALAVPVAVVCWLAHLRRPAPQPPAALPGQPPPPADANLDWFPAGDLLAWIAVMAGCLALASLLMIGTDTGTITATARALLERQMAAWARAGGRAATAAELDAITGVFVRLLPAATAMSWMFMMLLNLWLAGRIQRKSGRLFRPWPRLAALELPPWLTIALALTLAISFTSGLPALVAGGFASAFMTAYAAAGLAVLHWISHGKANRPFTLGAAYVSALMLAPYGTMPIAVVGLLEPWLRLRGRTPGPPPSQTHSPGPPV
jgi:Predicted membrane protein (DUF2232)